MSSEILQLASSARRLALGARDGLCRLKLYPLHRPAQWTISFGSLTDASTGATTVLTLAAATLAEQGKRVCILGGRGSSDGLPAALRRRDIPVFSGADHRDAMENALTSLDPQVLLLDDAFGARSLARDVDVVVMDALAPFGDGALWPAGELLEPAAALARAHLIVLTNADQAAAGNSIALREALRRHAPRTPVVQAAFRLDHLLDLRLRIRIPPSQLAGRKAAFFTSAVKSASFKSQMRGAGIEPYRGWRFHRGRRYSPRELRHIATEVGGMPLLTSLKDEPRLPESWQRDMRAEVYALVSRLEITDGAEAWAGALTPRTAA